MNLSAQFKEFLLSQATPPSKVTVKNYTSDINKFISWCEKLLGTNFSISDVDSVMLDSYKKEALTKFSASSVDRSMSSLRKFFSFLKSEGIVLNSPFEDSSSKKIEPEDPWRLRDFKNHLYGNKSSNLTIKNYIIDVKQFLSWAQDALHDPNEYNLNAQSIDVKIGPEVIEVYKEKLLDDFGLSPVSVNRKLSSLRKYIKWANEQGIIGNTVRINNIEADKSNISDFILTDEINIQEAADKAKEYSKLPPLRVVQKTANASTRVLDAVITDPLSGVLNKAEEAIWNIKGRPIFKTSTNYIADTISDPIITPNIPKSHYAPELISTRLYPLHKKAYHHIRYTRPKWYKRYHSYAFVSYLHLSILMLFISVMGYTAYAELKPQNQTPTFAALPSAPPRILSFQGKLSDASGNPINKKTSLRMAIYNNQTASGAALLWQEVVSPTPDKEGVFNVVLGKNTTIPQSVFAENSGLWLGVTVGNTSELKPRQQIATVAFATNAETLQGLVPITTTTKTSNVVLALNSSGNLTIGGSANPTFQATGGNFTLAGRALILTTSSNGDIQISPNGTGTIDLQKAIRNTSNSNLMVPGSVEVADVLVVNATSSGAILNIHQSSTGDLIIASTSGSTKFRVDNAGNLSINGTINGLTVGSGTITSGAWQGTAIGATYGGTGLNTSGSTGVPYISSGTWSVDANALAANHGGTGQTSYTIGDLLYASSTTGLSKLAIGTSSQCLIGGTTPSWGSCGDAADGASNWSILNGAISPNNSTLDFLIGGTATSSADFAIINVNGSGPATASVSGNLIVMPKNGQGGNVGIGTTNPTARLDLGTGNFKTTETGIAEVNIWGQGGAGLWHRNLTGGSSGWARDLASYYASDGSTPYIGFGAYGSGQTFNYGYIGSSANEYDEPWMAFVTGGKIGIGTTPSVLPTSALYVTRNLELGATGKALVIFDQTESQDIFTASASGTTRFVMQNDGDIGIGGISNPQSILDIRDDIPRISLFDTDSSISSTNPAWAIRSDNSGNFKVQSTTDFSTFSDRLTMDNAFRLGLGTSTPTSNLHVTRPLSFGTTGKALAIFDQIESQDILTASASGTTRFTIANNGSMTLNGGTTITASSLTTFTTGSTLAFSGNLTEAGSAVQSASDLDTCAEFAALGSIETGTCGSIVLSASPTLTGTVNAAALTLSGAFDANGDVSIADTAVTFDGAFTSFIVSGLFSVAAVQEISFDAGTDIYFDADGADVILQDSGTIFATFTNSSTDLTINAGGGQVLFADTDTFAIGGVAGGLAYNAISDSGGSSSRGLASDDDLFVDGEIEVDGTLWTDGGISSSGNINLNARAVIDRGTLTSSDPALTIRADNNFLIDPQFGSGNYNPLVQSGDHGIIFYDSTADTGALVIGPWSASSKGLRMDSSGEVTFANDTNLNGDLYVSNANPQIFLVDSDADDWEIFINGNNFTIEHDTSGQDFIRTDVAQDQVELWLDDELANNAMCYGGAETTANAIKAVGDCTGTGADYAERYPVEQGIEHRELVVTGTEDVNTYGAAANGSTDWNTVLGTTKRLVRSSAPYQANIIGITSDNYSDFTSTGNNIKDEDNPMSVALNGRVMLKVSGENGPINAGDMITSSSVPGAGMKATKAGRVVGMALSSYTGTGIGEVMVFVNIHNYDPDVQIAETGNLTVAKVANGDFEVQREGRSIDRIGAFGDIFVARIRAGYLETGRITTQALTSISGNFGELTTDSLAILTEEFSVAGQNIRDYIYSIVDERIGGNEIAISSPIEIDESGKKVSIKLKTNDRDSKFEIKNASGSAVASIDAEGNVQTEGDLSARNASLSGQLNSNGASIAGTLTANKIIANDIELSEEAIEKLIGKTSTSSSQIINNYYISTTSGNFTNQYQASTESARFGEIVASAATFENGLTSFGMTSFYEASIADRLFIGSQLSIADNEINVLGGKLHIQPLRQGGVSFMAGLIEIDTNGNLKVDGNAYFAKDVQVEGNLIANIISPLSGRDFIVNLGKRDEGESENHDSSFIIRNSSSSALLSVNSLGDLNASGSGTFSKLNVNFVGEAFALSDLEAVATGSAGTAQINANRTELTIRSSLVTENSLIYVTPKTSVPNQSVYLLRQTAEDPSKSGIEGSFTVGISQSINKKVPFNWIIIN